MLWALAQKIGKEGINILFMLWLASFLLPKDFGSFAIGLVWVGFARLFIDLGFPLAIIRKRDLHDNHLSSFFIFNIITGCLVFFLFICIVNGTDLITSDPDMKYIYSALSVTIIFDSISTVFRTVLQRELNFKVLAYRDITAAIAAGIAGVIFAIQGFEIWSLVVQSVFVSFFGLILFWILSDWKPRWHGASWGFLVDLWEFASKMTVAEVLKYISQNYQIFIVGMLFDDRTTGLFVFAWKFSILIFKEPIKAVDAFMFSRFSQEQNNKVVLANLYIQTIKMLLLIGFPLLVLYGIFIPDIIFSIYGDAWVECSSLIQILCFASFSYVYITTSTSIKKALGRGKWIIYWIVIFISVMTAMMFLGYLHGIFGLVAAVAIVHIFGALIALYAIGLELKITKRLMIELLPLTLLEIITLILVNFPATLMWGFTLFTEIYYISFCMVVYFAMSIFLCPKPYKVLFSRFF